MSFANILAFTVPGGKLVLTADETANDSDKTITVTSLKRWLILWIRAELATTANAGNRIMQISITDSADDIIWGDVCPFNQTASETINYQWYPSSSRMDDHDANGMVHRPIPSMLVLDEGYKIRILDGAAIDAAADDLVIQMMCLEIDLGKAS